MSDKDPGPTINFGDVKVEGGQASLGDNRGAKFEQHNYGTGRLVDDVFAPIEEAVTDQPWPDATPQEVVETHPTPAAFVAFAKATAANNEEETDTELVPFGGAAADAYVEKEKTWTEQFMHLAPLVGKAAVEGVLAAVESHVSKSPVISGVVAFAKRIKAG